MEDKEITLEKIELVKDRTGITYKDAKDALEFADGSVVDAIIYIEENINAENGGKKDKYISTAVSAIKEAIHKGNVNRITFKKEDRTVLNIPVNVGIVGTVIFPWASIIAVLTAFGTKCSIEIVKDDGEVINISDKANDAIDIAKSKGEIIFDEAKDKGADALKFAKVKGGEFVQYAKDKVLRKDTDCHSGDECCCHNGENCECGHEDGECKCEDGDECCCHDEGCCCESGTEEDKE